MIISQSATLHAANHRGVSRHLMGVGKPVEYSVLVDEIGVSQDELQGLLNSLCYSHQIVNSAISLPEPIYQADELAKRGQNNYLAMKRLEGNRITRNRDRLVDYRALTEMLCYKNSNLKSTRFTA
uniref:Piwi domain-containing protein n=1 Tax=Ditylenchus dipsaci TaxID=166011 RepID=A0A915DJS2_9BILA